MIKTIDGENKWLDKLQELHERYAYTQAPLPDDATELAVLWLEAKVKEAFEVNHRRRIEDKLAVINDSEADVPVSGLSVMLTSNTRRKVDDKVLKSLVKKHPTLASSVPVLFRNKIEVNARAWALADPSITKILGQAVIIDKGRPTVKITTT